MLFLWVNANHIMPVTLHAPVVRQVLTGSAFQARRRSNKLRQEWSLTIPHLTHAELDQFFGFYSCVQQDMTFWFDGAGSGEVRDVFVANTNGTDTEFMLPHDNIDASSLVCKVNGVIKSDWTLSGSSSALIFGTAPIAGILTASYWCKFLCLFNAGDEGFSPERFLRDLDNNDSHHSLSLTIQEVATP